MLGLYRELRIITWCIPMEKSLYLRQLKDRDPAKRKAAIHAAARAVDGDALKQLAIMCEDDPNEEVRDLALKVGVFIRKQVRGEGSSKVKAAVSDENARRAQGLINEAVTAQSHNQKSRAMKNLAQALRLDPNLRNDGYFINVVETVTGRPGEGAAVLALLDDKKEQKTLAQKEAQERQQKQLEGHLEEVNKIQWSAALFDAGLFFVVMFVGTVLVLFLAVQGAQGYVDKIDENIHAVNAARNDGRVRMVDGKEIFISTETDSAGTPKTFEAITVDREFWRQANNLRKTEFLALMPIALIVAVGGTVLTVLFSVIAHVMAALVLRGKGRLAYLAQTMLSMMTTRMLTLLIMLGVGMILIFAADGGAMMMIVAGAAGLMSCVFGLSLITLTGKAYNIGFAKALIAVLPAFIVVGVLGTVLSSLL